VLRNEEERRRLRHTAEIEGGIKVSPVPITAGDQVRVVYNGLLAACGADKVYLHAGYGSPYNWQGVADHPMVRTPEGWEAVVRVENASRFNFCFKDSANNWDNNNGRNWSYEIHYGGL